VHGNHKKEIVLLITIVVIALLLPSCRTNSPVANELIVSAAASLKDAFNEIAAVAKQKTGLTVRFNLGASGALQRQIESGVPADVFASAGAKQMDELAAKGLIVATTRKDFARNTLVLIVPEDSLAVASFADLSRPEIKRIAVGNPRTVPAGQYTVQTLTTLRLLPQLESKFVFAEDVRQVLDYVARSEVDAGIVYVSDVRSAGSKVRVAAQAPDDTHDPISYPIAQIKDSRQPAAAQKFIDLVLSAEGQKILAKYGFVPIQK